MPTKKIGSIDNKNWIKKIEDSKMKKSKKIEDFSCTHPEHDPPDPSGYMIFDPGIYMHKCPKCGSVTTFTVPTVVFGD